jgi:class 3 adenylate cyclase
VSESLAPLALPDEPALAEWATTLNEAGYWAQIFDAGWRLVFVTDELRMSYGNTDAASALPIGFHLYSTEQWQFRTNVLRGQYLLRDFRRANFLRNGGYVLASTPGGRDALRGVVAPEFADLVDEVQPTALPAAWRGATSSSTFAGVEVATSSQTCFRIDDDRGHIAGFGVLTKPAAGMSQLATAAYTADLAHLERMRTVEHPDRRPAAILMADLEASSPLARRLSTARYFAFGRRWVRAADQCVVDAGGIVGRHAGDGVVAFFLAETAGSESAAAKSSIVAARGLHDALTEAATRSEIPVGEVSLRFGLHWATPYIGRILTAGRSEVTALGDEVNEAARIEACASGGRTLASKSLIERLDRNDAQSLGIEKDGITYTQLADLATTTDKARRDAPAIAVCEI